MSPKDIGIEPLWFKKVVILIYGTVVLAEDLHSEELAQYFDVLRFWALLP